MKTSHISAVASLLACTHLFAQGDLLPPPGPPGPTMKTLDQVEARTIVNATNTPGDGSNSYIISLPGSYYLTSNLTGDSEKHGISIQASDVTLDLNGFALVNTTPGVGTVRGVDVPAEQKNVCVRNGTVRLWNDGGVRAETVRNALVEKLRVSDCTGAVGIYVGLGSLIKDCVANANGIGIQTPDRCQVMNCVSTENTSDGFNCTAYVTLMDCTSSRNGGSGIVVLNGCSVLRCNFSRNDLDGLHAVSSCTAVHCTADSNLWNGIYCTESSIANCTARGNSLNGIYNTRGSVANSTASYNGGAGIYAQFGAVTNSAGTYNLYFGILAPNGHVANSTAHFNGTNGISALWGSVTNSTARSNVESGFSVREGSITNCVATDNGNHGIDAPDSVVAFCNARLNNQNNNGSQDMNTPGGPHRTGNLPPP